MTSCICHRCRFLQEEASEGAEYAEVSCEFGFPSEQCLDCSEEGCEVTCRHFMAADEQELMIIRVPCSGCGKELEKIYSEEEEGSCYCVDCFLKGHPS